MTLKRVPYPRYSPEDLFDSPGQSFSNIICLGGTKANKFGATEGKRCRDEDRAETFKPRVKCSWIMEVFAANVTSVRSTSTVKDDTQNAGTMLASIISGKSEICTYINPITATTLTRENQNSTSPYSFTPNKLIMMIKSKNMVTHAAGETGEFQY